MNARSHLGTLLDDMRRLGSQPAVVEHRGVRRYCTSYASLAQGADWFAAELAARSIAPGERVVLWGENSAAWIACFFGCLLRGVLVVPLDAAGSEAFARRIVEETTPKLIVCDPALLATLFPASQPTSQSEDRLQARLFDLTQVDQAIQAALFSPHSTTRSPGSMLRVASWAANQSAPCASAA